MNRPAPFLPAADHLAYLANLLTVLAVLYGAWIVWRHDHRKPTTTRGGWEATV